MNSLIIAIVVLVVLCLLAAALFGTGVVSLVGVRFLFAKREAKQGWNAPPPKSTLDEVPMIGQGPDTPTVIQRNPTITPSDDGSEDERATPIAPPRR